MKILYKWSDEGRDQALKLQEKLEHLFPKEKFRVVPELDSSSGGIDVYRWEVQHRVGFFSWRTVDTKLMGIEE